jgi:hypothetical protein
MGGLILKEHFFGKALKCIQRSDRDLKLNFRWQLVIFRGGLKGPSLSTTLLEREGFNKIVESIT